MWLCLFKPICVISCVNFQRMCSAGSLFTQKNQAGQLRNNAHCQHQHHLHVFAPKFRSYEDRVVPVPAHCHGDGTITWDGLCGLAHEFAWSGAQTRRLEMAPGGALLGYTWFSKQPSHWTKSHGNAGVRRGGLTTIEESYDFLWFWWPKSTIPSVHNGSGRWWEQRPHRWQDLGLPRRTLSIVLSGAMSTPTESSVGSDPLNQISCTTFDRFQPL